MPKNTASDVYFGRSNTIRQAIESAKSSRRYATITKLVSIHSTSFSYFDSDLMILPDDLGNDLVNLVELNLSFNNLTHLPDSLAQLTNLKTLRITKNHFIDIPPCISNLTTLTHLNISGTLFSHFQTLISRKPNFRIAIRNRQFSQLKPIKRRQ